MEFLEPAITGLVASVATIAGIKMDLKHLRGWVERIDRVAHKANEKATRALARQGND